MQVIKKVLERNILRYIPITPQNAEFVSSGTIPLVNQIQARRPCFLDPEFTFYVNEESKKQGQRSINLIYEWYRSLIFNCRNLIANTLEEI